MLHAGTSYGTPHRPRCVCANVPSDGEDGNGIWGQQMGSERGVSLCSQAAEEGQYSARITDAGRGGGVSKDERKHTKKENEGAVHDVGEMGRRRNVGLGPSFLGPGDITALLLCLFTLGCFFFT